MKPLKPSETPHTHAHARYGSTPIANPRNPQTLYIGINIIYLYTGYWGVFLGICVGPHQGFERVAGNDLANDIIYRWANGMTYRLPYDMIYRPANDKPLETFYTKKVFQPVDFPNSTG